MGEYTLIRKRYIPNEEKDISNDELLYESDELLVTKWLPIHPRTDMSGGISYWFLTKGVKVSKIFDSNNQFKHFYCDIVQYEIDQTKRYYKSIDLLLDVIVQPDLVHYEILDEDELEDAFQKKIISLSEKNLATQILNQFLEEMKQNIFPFQLLD